MKKRSGFVSNSSSSSFIVSEEDNRCNICFGEYDVLTLEKYIKQFGSRDLFGYSFSKKIEDFKFVENPTFVRMFAGGCRNTLPKDVKELIVDYLNIANNRPNAKWDSKEYKEYYNKITIVENEILKKIQQILEPQWKDVKFHYAEVDDRWNDNLEEDEETIARDKLDYINTLKPFVFFREFCNH